MCQFFWSAHNSEGALKTTQDEKSITLQKTVAHNLWNFPSSSLPPAPQEWMDDGESEIVGSIFDGPLFNLICSAGLFNSHCLRSIRCSVCSFCLRWEGRLRIWGSRLSPRLYENKLVFTGSRSWRLHINQMKFNKSVLICK